MSTIGGNQNSCFFYASVPANVMTTIPSSIWPELSTKTDWQNPIINILSPHNPYCSFAMKNRWMKRKHSRKSSHYSFRCSGKCTFTDCPVQFHLKIMSFCQSNPPITLNVFINFTSPFVKHATDERRSRQIRSSNRTIAKKEVLSLTPSCLYNKKFSSLTLAELESGKRDKVGSSQHVLRKISSEGQRDQFPHLDLVMSLKVIDKEITESFGCKRNICGYIQRIVAKPFSVSFFTEEGVRIYHNFAKDQVLYLDATGTVISLKGTDYESNTSLYYALVVGHPKKGQPPVAVAELISTEHSVMAISHFLEDFRRHEALLYGHQNIVVPKYIIIDRSLVLLLSFLRVFNLETLSDYLHRCFRVANRCSTSSDFNKCFVHACISHVMKSAKYDMKKLL